MVCIFLLWIEFVLGLVLGLHYPYNLNRHFVFVFEIEFVPDFVFVLVIGFDRILYNLYLVSVPVIEPVLDLVFGLFLCNLYFVSVLEIEFVPVIVLALYPYILYLELFLDFEFDRIPYLVFVLDFVFGLFLCNLYFVFALVIVFALCL